MTNFGLCPLQPLKVRDYLLWLQAKPGFELNLNTLPPKLAKCRWFDALWQHDRAAAEAVLRVIAKCCGLPTVCGNYPINAETETWADGSKHVATVRIHMYQYGGRWVNGGNHLYPVELDLLRKRICFLNGYHLPGEDEEAPLPRPDPLKGRHVDFRLEAMVAAVAVHTGKRPSEVEEWTVKEFNEAMAAITRMEQFRICALLEATGLFEWKHSNPCPLWTLEVKSDLPPGYASIQELDEDAGGLLTHVET